MKNIYDFSVNPLLLVQKVVPWLEFELKLHLDSGRQKGSKREHMNT